MAVTRTTTSPSAGDDGTATWAQAVYTDLGNLVTQSNQLLADKTVYQETDGATVTFNLSNSKIQRVTLGGNRALALSNEVDNRTFIIILQQDATGSRTVTWWSGIQWTNGVAPTLTTTANKYDAFGFVKLGSTYLGIPVAQNM